MFNATQISYSRYGNYGMNVVVFIQECSQGKSQFFLMTKLCQKVSAEFADVVLIYGIEEMTNHLVGNE